MSASDWAQWAGVAVALAGTVWAIVTSWRAKRDAQEALAEARRQSEALERLASVAEGPLLVIEEAPPHSFVLRNAGRDRLTLQFDEPPAAAHDLPERCELRPGEGLSFFMTNSLAAQIPPHLEVRVEGHLEPVLVPIPG
jgi:hypothetical protein